jgi:hypothetical protein
MAHSIRPKLILASAGAVLLLGTAFAGVLYLSPRHYRGPDTAQIAKLAARLQRGTGASPVRPLRVGDAAPRVLRRPPVRPSVPSNPAAARNPGAVQSPRPPVVPEGSSVDHSASSAGRGRFENLALFGITHDGSRSHAWLLDRDSGERESPSVGESAFGVTVKEIEGERVVLTAGGAQVRLRLGERPIRLASASSEGETAERGADGWAPPVPAGGAAARTARAAARSARGFRPTYGGIRRSSARRGSTPAGRRRAGRTAGPQRAATRALGRGAAAMARGFRPAGAMRTADTRRSTLTANPQTARRLGIRLVGGGAPLPAPEPLANPQTLRRTGSTQGAAFGAGAVSQPQRGRSAARTGRQSNSSRTNRNR